MQSTIKERLRLQKDQEVQKFFKDVIGYTNQYKSISKEEAKEYVNELLADFQIFEVINLRSLNQEACIQIDSETFDQL